MKRLYKKYFGEFLLVLGALSYSFEWLFTRNLFKSGYTSFEITFAKMFFAMLALILFFLLFKQKTFKKIKWKKMPWFYLLLLGLGGLLSTTAFNNAINHTSVSNVLMLAYLAVFWNFIFGVLFLKEHFSYHKLAYTICAFFGILLVVSQGIGTLSFSFGKGEFWALIVSVFLAISVIINKHLAKISVSFRLLSLFVIASLFALAFMLSTESLVYFERFFRKEYLVNGGLLALTSGVMAKAFANWGTNYVPVSIVLIIMLFEPIVQVTTAYFFADELISLVNLLGILIVFAMVILISRENKKLEKVTTKV